MRDPTQLFLPFYSQFTLRIYTAMNGLGGGAQTDFVPGHRKPSTALKVYGVVILPLMQHKWLKWSRETCSTERRNILRFGDMA